MTDRTIASLADETLLQRDPDDRDYENGAHKGEADRHGTAVGLIAFAVSRAGIFS